MAKRRSAASHAWRSARLGYGVAGTAGALNTLYIGCNGMQNIDSMNRLADYIGAESSIPGLAVAGGLAVGTWQGLSRLETEVLGKDSALRGVLPALAFGAAAAAICAIGAADQNAFYAQHAQATQVGMYDVCCQYVNATVTSVSQAKTGMVGFTAAAAGAAAGVLKLGYSMLRGIGRARADRSSQAYRDPEYA
ncbi:MAG: hypothetical protein ACOCWQ_03930 [Nanoarchaeota archaeon]